MFKAIKLMASAGVIIYSTTSMADLAGVQGTLSNIESALNDAVRKAERLYEEKHGRPMRSHFNMVKRGQNPYLHTLRIAKNYQVQVKFSGQEKRGKRGAVTVPTAKALLGTEILLIPVYHKGDEKITAWECLTNVDAKVQQFMGDAGTKEYTASFIRAHTKNKYLSLCTYINKDLVR